MPGMSGPLDGSENRTAGMRSFLLVDGFWNIGALADADSSLRHMLTGVWSSGKGFVASSLRRVSSS